MKIEPLSRMLSRKPYFAYYTGGLFVESAETVERVARAFGWDTDAGAVPALLLLLETPQAILRAAAIAAATDSGSVTSQA